VLASISRWVKADRTSSDPARDARPSEIYDFLRREVGRWMERGTARPPAVHGRRAPRDEELGTSSCGCSPGAHLDNQITHPRVQKPGLAFAGYYAYIKPGRVQIIGESETNT
jgi:hypothetical protein